MSHQQSDEVFVAGLSDPFHRGRVSEAWQVHVFATRSQISKVRACQVFNVFSPCKCASSEWVMRAFRQAPGLGDGYSQ